MKNIMLLFLSEMHFKDNNKYQHTKYVLDDGTVLDCVQTNESAVRYLMHSLQAKGETLDDIFLFSTNRVREKVAVKDDQENFTILTHEECFEKRLQAEFASHSPAIHITPYDESEPVEESIRRVASMAEEIKKYQKQHADEPIVLHADMTGGFRHASMMMLAVMQLLKYYHIQIGRVVYSNYLQKKIEDVTEVHRMFTLVSGADEFVRFGSVQAIREYFSQVPATQQSQSLRELLQAMQEFSDAIAICRTGLIDQAVQELNTKIETFWNSWDKNLQENVFVQIIETIRDEYGALIQGNNSQLDIIEWCLDKGFLQQAMTLCTEWLPGYMVKHHICYTDLSAVQRRCRELGKKSGRTTWEPDFIITYNDASPESGSTTAWGKEKNFLQERVQRFNKTMLPEDIEDDLTKFFREARAFHCAYPSGYFCDCLETEMCTHYPRMGGLRKIIWQRRMKKNPQTTPDYTVTCQRMQLKTLLNELAVFSEKELAEIFAGQPATAFSYRPHHTIHWTDDAAVQQDPGWFNTRRRYRALFEAEVMKTSMDPNQALEALRQYYFIRRERNNVNHANATQYGRSNQEIKEMVSRCLELLKKLPNENQH